MQTFLPYSDFAESARVLDRQRLGKQRVEVLQIMGALADPTKGWQNHPATNMWRGYSPALLTYQANVCKEWTDRGYRDTCWEKTLDIFLEGDLGVDESKDPKWLGNEDFHASHRSNLLRKDPDWYSQFGWTEPDSLPYVWPSND